MAICKVFPIGNGVLQINETDDSGFHQVDAYLVIGKKAAALIDTCEHTKKMYGIVREITSLPLYVLITHGHPDHAGRGLHGFFKHGDRVFMNSKDIPILTHADPSFSSLPFAELSEGMTFDLGGTVLEAIAVPGHTPGSFVFLDEKGRRLYSGDAVGSGEFWMQLPECLPLPVFLKEAKRLRERIRECDPGIYPGHRYQADGLLKQEYLDDVIAATEEILAGRYDDAPVKTMDLGSGVIRFKEAAKGILKNYCFAPEKA